MRTCDCGDKEEEKIPKKDHTYGEWVVTTAATCTTAGSQEHTCSVCNYVETVTLPATAENAYDSTELYDLYLNSVGEIVTYDKSGKSLSLGSCFVQSADGKLITNYHVIDGAYSAKVTLGGTTYDVQQVLAYDKDIDAAVLQISASGLKPVVICEQEHKAGETVYAFGSSKGMTATFSDGMITHAKREESGVTYVQHSAPISSGNSGGPLINSYGEVIGINTLTLKDSQNLNFAVCIAELKNLENQTPMSMSKFYETECDPYERLASYIVTKGSRDSGDDYYVLVLSEDYSSDYTTKFTLMAMYYPDDGEILMAMGVDSEVYTYIVLTEEIDGVYDWYYFDDYDYEMSGTVRGSTLTENTLLGYSSNNISNSSLRSSIRELASDIVILICMKMNTCLTDIGLTAQDFGFVNF